MHEAFSSYSHLFLYFSVFCLLCVHKMEEGGEKMSWQWRETDKFAGYLESMCVCAYRKKQIELILRPLFNIFGQFDAVFLRHYAIQFTILFTLDFISVNFYLFAIFIALVILMSFESLKMKILWEKWGIIWFLALTIKSDLKSRM